MKECGWCLRKDPRPQATHVSVYGCWVCGKMDEVYFCDTHQQEMLGTIRKNPDSAYGHSHTGYGNNFIAYEWVHGTLPDESNTSSGEL